MVLTVISSLKTGRVQDQSNVDVRLVGGKQKGQMVISGRVEVRANPGAEWGSVCDDDFDDDDAM